MASELKLKLSIFIIFAALSVSGISALAEVSLIDQQDSFHWYQEAKYYASNRKNYEKALEYCEKAIKLNPDNLQAVSLKTWLIERIAKLDELKKRKQEIESLPKDLPKPKDAPADGKKAGKSEEIKGADAATGEAALKAAGLAADEKVNEAINNLNYYQGLTKLTEGKFDEAAQFFKDDLIENPDRIESWFYIFKYNKDNGNESLALNYLKKVREKIRQKGINDIDPKFKALIVNQCHLYQDEAILQKGLYKNNLDIEIKNEIKSNLDWRAVSIIPETSEILQNKKLLASVDIPRLKENKCIPMIFDTPAKNFKIDQYGKVIADSGSFRKKPKLEIPVLVANETKKVFDDVEKLIKEGDYYMYIGVYDRALSYYEEALMRAPDSPIANNNKGAVLKMKGRYEEAYEYFKKAIYYDKTYIEAYNNLATIYSERGNYDEALKLFLVAAKLNPREPGIVYNIGVMYSKLGKLEPADEYVSRAIAMNPAEPSYYYQLGQIKFRKGNKNDAYKNFRKLATMLPKDSDAYLKVVELVRTMVPEEK